MQSLQLSGGCVAATIRSTHVAHDTCMSTAVAAAHCLITAQHGISEQVSGRQRPRASTSPSPRWGCASMLGPTPRSPSCPSATRSSHVCSRWAGTECHSVASLMPISCTSHTLAPESKPGGSGACCTMCAHKSSMCVPSAGQAAPSPQSAGYHAWHTAARMALCMSLHCSQQQQHCHPHLIAPEARQHAAAVSLAPLMLPACRTPWEAMHAPL